jgi:uncharacterized repeat protein (TIGR03806 family)
MMCPIPLPSLPLLFLAASALAAPLRQPNPALNVPPSPPPTNYSLVDAFPGLNFDAPTCLASPPAPSTQLFVCEKGGKIWVVPDVTAATPTKLLFMDVAELVNARSGVERFRTVGEAGLLGLAFHPDYASNRRFFVFYTPGLGTGSTPPLHQRLSRFIRHPSNPNAADTTSETVFLEMRDQQDNHQGGDIHFGPDGYLYVSFGDEGGQNDARFNAQRIDKDFYSGILRIDVDKKPGNLEPSAHPNPAEDPVSSPVDAVKRDAGIARYSIPSDNPFVGATTFNGQPVSVNHVRTEFWAVGMRNPWRMSFDGPDLWVGDVGGSKREEINKVTASGNYGWIYREGASEGPWDSSSPSHDPQPPGFTSIAPVYHYARGSGTLQGDSVTGGVVYRGTAISALVGRYLFADYVSGNVWSMNTDGTNVTRITGQGGISAFGKNPANQDVLLADYNDDKILRLTSSEPAGSFPDALSETGLFSDLAALTPAPGLVPYSVNLPFWSDHAIKRRWFTLPDPLATFTWSKDDPWTLPAGTVWVKHFDMEMQRGVAASKKRIETRLLVKNASGAYGVSYRWNAAGTEATLVADEGVDLSLAITENGTPVPQTWRIPSRAECMICHTPQAGHALSFNTRQLNLSGGIPGHTGNQLTTLFNEGYFSTNPGSPHFLPRHLKPGESDYSTEARVRSYLAVNCAYCHQAGGTALGQWDGSSHLALEQTGLVNGTATQNGGNPGNKLIVPGVTMQSIVLHRVAATNGFTRMPPLGSNVIDTANVALVTNWIEGELDERQTYDAWRISNFEPDLDPAGAPEADADGDGVTNRNEFLAGTAPRDGSSAFRPTLSSTAPSLRFSLPANRSFRIEVSNNLDTWAPWDIPQNQGLPVAGGLVEITFPLTDPQRFFRVELSEN